MIDWNQQGFRKLQNKCFIFVIHQVVAIYKSKVPIIIIQSGIYIEYSVNGQSRQGCWKKFTFESYAMIKELLTYIG